MARHVVNFKTEGGIWQQILQGMIISKTKKKRDIEAEEIASSIYMSRNCYLTKIL